MPGKNRAGRSIKQMSRAMVSSAITTKCLFDKQMDSGGPVLWENPMSKRLTLIGIISNGIGCAVKSGINTRVGAYIDWITSVTPGTKSRCTRSGGNGKTELRSPK